MTHVILISKPGLICNSLLAYCRSLASHHIAVDHLEPGEYLRQAAQATADLLIILEEDNPREVEQVIASAASTQVQAVIIVNDINRQRILRMQTDQPVLLWGLINQSLAQYIFDRHAN